MSTEHPKTTELIETTVTLPSVVLQDAAADAQRYAASSRAAATYRAYQSDWRIFTAWCEAVNLAALPATPMTVAMFLATQANGGTAPSTLARRLAAIRLMHLGAKVPSPHGTVEVLEVMRGIRRRSNRGVTKKKAAVAAQLKRMVDATAKNTFQGIRDRALLLMGFAGAFRRAELVALDVEHLTLQPEGLKILIPKSKTDQERVGQTIGIPREPDSPYCPVQALEQWMAAAGITKDAIFLRVTKGNRLTADRLTDQSVARIIKKLAGRVGLLASQYAGHSLRSGFLTSAAEQHANIFKMKAQSRHKSLDVLSGYVQDQDLFEDHAGSRLLGP